jgi:hypothetical protein
MVLLKTRPFDIVIYYKSKVLNGITNKIIREYDNAFKNNRHKRSDS